MKIAVLGTGVVGRALAGRLSQLDHEVTVGTRDPAATLARTEPDQMGNPPYGQWQAQHAAVQLTALADAAAEAEVVVNATAGGTSLAALDAAGATNLAGKVLLDVANPLDFSQGMPPILSPSNTDSLGEQIQRAHPQARVVKTLNTMSATVMVDPARLPDSHEVFVAATTRRPRRPFGTCSGSSVGLTNTSVTWVGSAPPAARRCTSPCG